MKFREKKNYECEKEKKSFIFSFSAFNFILYIFFLLTCAVEHAKKKNLEGKKIPSVKNCVYIYLPIESEVQNCCEIMPKHNRKSKGEKIVIQLLMITKIIVIHT